MQKLTREEIAAHVEQLQGWKFINEGIEKDYVFKDFTEAFAFITRIALLAEKYDHHPEWSNVYNKLHLKFSTHDAGGLTSLDIDMATAIDKMQ